MPIFPATAWGLPEEDQVLFLLTAPKEMDQLVEFLICLTDLQGAEDHIYVKIISIVAFKFSLPTLPPLQTPLSKDKASHTALTGLKLFKVGLEVLVLSPPPEG